MVRARKGTSGGWSAGGRVTAGRSDGGREGRKAAMGNKMGGRQMEGKWEEDGSGRSRERVWKGRRNG